MLIERLNDDLKKAMKARDTLTVSVLRMVLSEIKNARIAKGKDLTDDEVLKVIRRGVKQREESAQEYRRGDRADLVESEEKEAAILQTYLPRRIEGQALEELVKAKIHEVGASSMKDMGKVMQAVMAEHGAAVDGKEVQALVRAHLGGS